MFDNRWDNWSGDFAESFAAGLLDSSVRSHVPLILTFFGKEMSRLGRNFPDEVAPGAFANVLREALPRLNLPPAARDQAPEVIARFLEYLQETGRVGEGEDWAAEVRTIAASPRSKNSEGAGGAKGVPIRKPVGTASVGRNEPCPCGSGKKFKKCCMV
jgi:SEC-C motif